MADKLREHVNDHQIAVDGLALKQVKGGKKANLPEILESSLDDREEIAIWLERTLDAKRECESITAQYKEALEYLAAVTASNGLEGLRTGKVVFTMRLQKGRSSMSTEKLVQELLSQGVKIDVINGCIERATSQGEPFWVKQIESL